MRRPSDGDGDLRTEDTGKAADERLEPAGISTEPGVTSREVGATSRGGAAASRQIRGSSLLLAGTVLAAVIDFAGQVMFVRYLSRAEFGAWSYALAMVTLFGSLAQFEMRNAVARFVPVYLERKETPKLLGAITLACGLVIGLGTLLAVSIVVAVSSFDIRPTSDPEALRLLVLVAFLIPIQSVDSLLTGLFAAFGASRTIFLRQSVLAPGLRLAVVLSLIVLHADITFFALGYMAATLLGVVVSSLALRRTLRTNAVLGTTRLRAWRFPARELLFFAVPLLTSTLVWTLMESSDAVLLGFFYNSEAVASFRVVVPMARFNQLVAGIFSLLYLPAAARAFAAADKAEIANLYWRTALWMTVLSFPIFVLTFSFAPSVTRGVYGDVYAGSAPILAVLAVGYFFNAALGFNGITLRVHNRLRYMMAVDISMATLNIMVNLVLIPRLGPFGAAIGTAATLSLHNVLKHFGLRKFTSIGLLRYARIYATFAALAVLLLAVQWLASPSLPVALVLAGAAGLVGLWIARDHLEFDTVFPELGRLPFLRWLTRRSTRGSGDGGPPTAD